MKPRILSKVKQDEAESIIVELFWPNQVWYPVVLKMLISIPVLLNSRRTLLHLPQSPMQVHPMWPKRKQRLSGSRRNIQSCRKELLKLYQHLGELGPKSDTKAIKKKLLSFLPRGTKITFRQPLKIKLSSWQNVVTLHKKVFECVWPFFGVTAERIKIFFSIKCTATYFDAQTPPLPTPIFIW